MCCLNGAAGAVSSKEEQVVKTLLLVGQLRGTDSTGLISLGRNSQAPVMAKALGPPEFLFDMKKFDVAFRGTNKIYMGHNRSKTVGGSKLSNAHPFCFPHVFGTHNGTVYRGLEDLPEQFETDSETIINSFNEIGVEETVPKITGAWAFAWYDNRDDSINFLRNAERPLYYAFSKDEKTLFWSSMVEMLALSLNAHKIERTDPKAKLLPENTWYKFIIPKNTYDKFAAPIIKHVEGKKPVNFTRGGGTTGVDDDEPFGEFAYGAGPYLRRENSERQGELGYIAIGRRQEALTEKHNRLIENHNKGATGSNVVELTPQRKDQFEAALANIKANQADSVAKDAYPMLYKSPVCKIHYGVKEGMFSVYRYTIGGGWHNLLTATCPDELKGQNITEIIRSKRPLDGKAYETYKGLSPTHEPIIPGDQVVRWRSGSIIVCKKKNAIENQWVTYRWYPVQKGWRYTENAFPPNELPFTLLDIRSNHLFVHKGKKKRNNKEIFYKGYYGTRLTRKQFNDLTECGCMGCGRSPKWIDGLWGGMEATWIGPTYFLCEYCKEDTATFKALLKKQEVEKTTGDKRVVN